MDITTLDKMREKSYFKDKFLIYKFRVTTLTRLCIQLVFEEDIDKASKIRDEIFREINLHLYQLPELSKQKEE
jgi:hypothetical protein